MLCLFFLICDGSPTSRDVYEGMLAERSEAGSETSDRDDAEVAMAREGGLCSTRCFCFCNVVMVSG